MIVVVSPHLDDAVLSVGAWLSWHPGARIVTVFAGVPDRDIPTPGWDIKCGFMAAREAMLARRSEDVRATMMLAASFTHCGLLDGQYREGAYPDGIIDAAVVGALWGLSPSMVVVPLGIGHDDHIALGAACRRVLAGAPYTVVAYEENPYRVEMPDQAVHTLDALAYARWYSDAPPDPRLAAEAKRRALSRYASQMWAIPAWAQDVPERMWTINQPEPKEETDD